MRAALFCICVAFGVAILSLTSCSKAPPPDETARTAASSRQKQFVLACQRRDGPDEVCKCIDYQIRDALADADYQLFLRFAEVASATTPEAIAAGAALTSEAAAFIGEEERLLTISAAMAEAAGACRTDDDA